MYTAIIEFNSLSDSVWTATENHNFLLLSADWILVFSIICWVVVCAVFCSAYMNTFPFFFHSDCKTSSSYFVFIDFQNLAEVFIWESVFLCLSKCFVWWKCSFVLQKCFFLFHKFFHLLNEIFLHFCDLMNFINSSTFSQCLIHNKMSFTCRCDQHF